MGEVNRVQLTQEACRALVEDARFQFANGTDELWRNNDESQRPTVEACTEILGQRVYRHEHWPTHDTPFGKELDNHIEAEFTFATMAWLDEQRRNQADHVAYLDRGGETGPEFYAERQVYLLHVLSGLSAQRKAVAV